MCPFTDIPEGMLTLCGGYEVINWLDVFNSCSWLAGIKVTSAQKADTNLEVLPLANEYFDQVQPICRPCVFKATPLQFWVLPIFQLLLIKWYLFTHIGSVDIRDTMAFIGQKISSHFLSWWTFILFSFCWICSETAFVMTNLQYTGTSVIT